MTKVPVVLPITGGGNLIRCDQPRALDLRARGGKKLESAPDPIMDEALAKLVRFLGKTALLQIAIHKRNIKNS